MKRGLLASYALLFAGFTLISLSAGSSIVTGNAVFNQVSGSIASFVGLVFVGASLGLFLAEGGLEQEVENGYHVGPYNPSFPNKKIEKISKKVDKKPQVKKEIDSLANKLYEGNTNAGRGTKRLFSNVYYMRGDTGARLFYLDKGDNSYEVLGYAYGGGQGKGKDKSERQIISALENLHDNGELGSKEKDSLDKLREFYDNAGN
ncbi:MAG: hypothetical protein ABEI74_00335 [Candidatus Pacearchaeota archaeon]